MAIGVVVGVPIGIALGRVLWDLFAHEISAVPMPSVPGLVIVLIVVGALALAHPCASSNVWHRRGAISGASGTKQPTSSVPVSSPVSSDAKSRQGRVAR